MLLGRSIIYWVLIAFIAVCVFFLAQYLISALFGVVDVSIPVRIVNILAILIAVGVFWYGGWGRGAAL